MPTQECIQSVIDASGGRLSATEAADVLERMEHRRAALLASGKIDGLDYRLRELASQDADRVRMAAALSRKHAALNAIVRDKTEGVVAAHMESGLSPQQAVLAVLEGVNANVRNGRLSVAQLVDAYEARYLTSMTAALSRDVPLWERRLRDRGFLNAVVREMYELRDGGRPGTVGDPDAAKVAKIFAEYSELARLELNRLGANISKLDGWAGPQSYDPQALLRAGRDAWVDDMIVELDLDRTFEGLTADDARAVLRDIWLTITTGRDNSLTPAERGDFTGPANVAKTLSRHRVLHYRDADAWLRVQERYGQDHIFGAIASHQMRAAHLAAQMQMLGPNPEVMLGSLMESLARRVRNDANIPADQKSGLIDDLSLENVAIKSAMAEMQGLHNTVAPGRRAWTAAAVSSAIRAVQTMAKLGTSVFAQISDIGQSTAQLRYNGVPIHTAYERQFRHVLAGRPTKEQREIAHLIGVGANGIIDSVAARWNVDGGLPGRFTRAVNGFFKLNGMTWLQNSLERANALILSAHLGRQMTKAWDAVDADMKNQLNRYGIGEAEWSVLRQGDYRTIDGERYVTGDRVRDIPLEAMDPLIEGKITELARIRARDDLEIKLRTYQVDQTFSGIIRPSARSRRWLLRGTQRGTAVGEAMRFFAQFKGFPTSFTERALGQAFLGGTGSRGAQAVTVAHLIAATTVAGMITNIVYDFLNGYEPRDPTDPRTLIAGFARGGGAGIFGDFLFGQASYGVGALEAGLGPVVGETSKLLRLWYEAREGDADWADVFRSLTSNVPGQNLWWSRSALDIMILNELREALSPGYLRRQEGRRERDFGQSRILPATVWR